MRRRPPQAGEPRRPGQGPPHRRVRRSADRRRAARFRIARAHRARVDHRRPHPEGDPRSPAVPRTTSASAISRSAAAPRRCPAAKASASASPPRSARNLTGVLYVLDEPSIGLHQRDNRALLTHARHVFAISATPCIVVEHDEETIRKADYVVDLGPGAGEHGGEVIFQGTPAQLLDGPRRRRARQAPPSLTGAYLRGERTIETPRARRAGTERRARHPRRAREQPEEHRRRDSRWGCSPR